MAIDQDFLRLIQRRGWQIVSADEEHVWAGCPREGCKLTVRLRPDGLVPDACGRGADLTEHVVTSFDVGRLFLRDRRVSLGLSIREVEEIGGIAEDFLAKFEKDNPSKTPNAQTFLEWAKALGYEVVLRPSFLPPLALRIIAETRAKLRSRITMFRVHAARRLTRSEEGR